ncbi:MAG: hypothetical protein LBP92_03775 [Deltaproteobacteria bacterium]|nr:hypothetical protein [Deltaproteobacteria bacterium]
MTETLKVAYSSELLAEYSDVLFRPRLRIQTDEAAKVINAIQEHGMRIEQTPSAHYMVDEDDRVFHDVAKSAGAYLVTGNRKHYPDEAFIVTPTCFLSLWLAAGARIIAFLFQSAFKLVFYQYYCIICNILPDFQDDGFSGRK